MRLKLFLASLALGVTLASFALAAPPPMSSSRPHHLPRTQQAYPQMPSFKGVDPNATDLPEEGIEEEGPPGDFRFWDTQVFNNKQPPYAAMLFNFAILVFIYYRFGKQPIADALKNRKLSIAGAIEGAQRILREAKERSKRYRAKLGQVEEDAEQGKQALVSTGKGEAEIILRAADEKVERIKRDAAFLVEQEKKQTQLDLLKETVERATQEAETLLRANVKAEDQERLAQEFLDKLARDYAKGLPLGGPS